MSLNETHIIKEKINNFRRLLLEYVSRQDIVDAIQNHEVVKIYYQGDNTVNRGYRTIEPYVIGKSNAGNIVVRAWQQAGSTDRGVNPKRTRDMIPGWRLFRLDGISQILPTGKKFTGMGINDEFVNKLKEMGIWTNELKTKLKRSNYDVDNISEIPDELKDEFRDNVFLEKGRPKYNSEGDGGMSEILMQVDFNKDAGFNLSGFDSIQDPNIISTRVASFDPEISKYNKYSGDERNKEEIRKNVITNLYQMVKDSRKQNPANYIVVNRDGRLYADKTDNENQYDKKDVLGNLNHLARKVNNIPVGKRITRSELDKRREDFKKKMEQEYQENQETM